MLTHSAQNDKFRAFVFESSLKMTKRRGKSQAKRAKQKAEFAQKKRATQAREPSQRHSERASRKKQLRKDFANLQAFILYICEPKSPLKSRAVSKASERAKKPANVKSLGLANFLERTTDEKTTSHHHTRAF